MVLFRLYFFKAKLKISILSNGSKPKSMRPIIRFTRKVNYRFSIGKRGNLIWTLCLYIPVGLAINSTSKITKIKKSQFSKSIFTKYNISKYLSNIKYFIHLEIESSLFLSLNFFSLSRKTTVLTYKLLIVIF
jgi:hypothetical protein